MKIVPHLCLAVLICAALIVMSRNTDWIHPAPAAANGSLALGEFTAAVDRDTSESDIDPCISIAYLADMPGQTTATGREATMELSFQSAAIVTLACREEIEYGYDVKADNQILFTAVREVWAE